MRRKRKKCAPSTIDVDNLVIDTTRTERFHIFETLYAIRKYLTIVLMISGSLSTFFSFQFFMGVEMFSSSFGFIALIAMGFVGITNIISGLLLLASE